METWYSCSMADLHRIDSTRRWRNGLALAGLIIPVGCSALFERQARRLDALAGKGRTTAAEVTAVDGHGTTFSLRRRRPRAPVERRPRRRALRGRRVAVLRALRGDGASRTRSAPRRRRPDGWSRWQRAWRCFARWRCWSASDSASANRTAPGGTPSRWAASSRSRATSPLVRNTAEPRFSAMRCSQRCPC